MTPKNYYDKTFRFYEKNFHGSSFLVNPVALLEKGRAFSDKEVAEYVGVASFRNSFEYAKTKDTTLDFLMSPISEEIITKNRLLELKDGRVHFLFEETWR